MRGREEGLAGAEEDVARGAGGPRPGGGYIRGMAVTRDGRYKRWPLQEMADTREEKRSVEQGGLSKEGDA